jgi:hypothetical protein
MSNPLSWEEQALNDPDALRSFIVTCDVVREAVGSNPVVYRSEASSKQMAKELEVILKKHPGNEMWFVGGPENAEGIRLLAFCGNGMYSQSKAQFIQLALQLLPVLLQDRLGWIELMGETLDVDDQLRNTES